MASKGSTGVEYSAHNPEIESSNPAPPPHPEKENCYKKGFITSDLDQRCEKQNDEKSAMTFYL
jgi:hypothetical protein